VSEGCRPPRRRLSGAPAATGGGSRSPGSAVPGAPRLRDPEVDRLASPARVTGAAVLVFGHFVRGVVAGPVALFGTLSILLVGQFRDFIFKLFTSQVTGDTLQAAPTGAQTADERCGTLTLTNLQVRGISGTGTVADCWSR
jgi:hypothetical protein